MSEQARQIVLHRRHLLKVGFVRHFSSADGLPHGECMAAVCDRHGSLWFATKQGLSRLAPEEDRSPEETLAGL